LVVGLPELPADLLAAFFFAAIIHSSLYRRSEIPVC